MAYFYSTYILVGGASSLILLSTCLNLVEALVNS